MCAILSRGVDQPHNIGWCNSGSGVGRFNVVQRQDGGVAPSEAVGLHAGKIVLIDVRWQDKAWGGWSGTPLWVGAVYGRGIKATC